MKSFKQYLAECKEKEKAVVEYMQLFEHQVYKSIPGTNNSFRTDSGNTNTLTMKHFQVYAKPNGKGKELYSVNTDGSGHDGSSGIKIPASHANHFRSLGHKIPDDNILESLSLQEISPDDFKLMLLKNKM